MAQQLPSLSQLKNKLLTDKTAATNSGKDLNAADKVASRPFDEPGVYEVHSAGVIEKTTKDGKTFLAADVTDNDGRTGMVFIRLQDAADPTKRKTMALQALLSTFGVAMKQAWIDASWDTLLSCLPILTVGNAKIKVGYFGFVPWYKAKGHYGIRDFSKDGGGAYVIDPANLDEYKFATLEEAKAFMTEHKMKGGKNTDFIPIPAESFKQTSEQIEYMKVLLDVYSDEEADSKEDKEEETEADMGWLNDV